MNNQITHNGTIIVGVSKNSIIGKDNTIPWHYPADLKRFKALTSGGTIIMGRKTFVSIGRPLPKRRNIVISSSKVDVDGVETFSSLLLALSTTQDQAVWYIGGRGIYLESLKYAKSINLTIIPEVVERTGNIIEFPWIDPTVFKITDMVMDPDTNLCHIRYDRS